jgi:LysR family transcriptional activator of glutamate synthase operon
VEPRQLTHFLVAARHEHIAAAAAELGIDQSTLSRGIARMERHYGVALFDRIGRGLRLNDHGRVLQEYAERACHELESAELALRSVAKHGDSRIRLGFIPSLGPEMVPRLISSFRDDNTRVQFRLTEAPRATLRDLLLSGTLDLTLATHGFEDPAVRWLPISENRLVALMPSGHRLAGLRDIALGEISSEPLMIFRSAQTARDVLRDALLAKNIIFESDDYATLLGLVAADHGIAIVPADLQRKFRGVKHVRIRSAPNRTIGVTWARSRPLSEIAHRFCDFISTRRPGKIEGWRLGG